MPKGIGFKCEKCGEQVIRVSRLSMVELIQDEEQITKCANCGAYYSYKISIDFHYMYG